jgi:hypothetical protein
MPDKIATKVVCEICNHDIQEDLETITMNGYDYTFCIDSRACVLRENHESLEVRTRMAKKNTDLFPKLVKTKYQVKAQKTVEFYDNGVVKHAECDCHMNPYGHSDNGCPKYFCKECKTLFVDTEANHEYVTTKRQNRIDFLKRLKNQGASYAYMAYAEGKNYMTTFMFCKKYGI